MISLSKRHAAPSPGRRAMAASTPRHRRRTTRFYSIAIRYRREPDGKLRWFTGVQEAASAGEATRLGREAFAAELPGTEPTGVFVSRLPRRASP